MSLALLLVLAQVDGGQLEPAVTVDAAELHDAPDAGAMGPALEQLGGAAGDVADRARLLVETGWRVVGAGCYLPEGRCVHAGGEVARLKGENADLRRAPTLLSWDAWIAVGVAALLFFAFGVWGGVELKKLIPGL